LPPAPSKVNKDKMKWKPEQFKGGTIFKILWRFRIFGIDIEIKRLIKE
jgi:hypothetical protein